MGSEVIGKTIDGKYRIMKFLGQGGFGEVYQAQQLGFGVPIREVALKIFSNELKSQNDALTEVVTLAALLERQEDFETRKHLISMYDAGFLRDLDERPAYSMELVRGGTLSDKLVLGSVFPVHGSLYYMKQIAVGMSALHNLNPPYIHRDLKPENILLTVSGQVKIADFGLATAVDHVLRTASSAGTLSYQAPESLMLSICTPATDVYSMGLIFYQMLAGRNPFNHLVDKDEEGRNTQAQIEARLDEGFLPLPSRFSVELRSHKGLEAIIMKCLAVDQVNRYSSAKEFLEDLERYEQGLSPAAFTSQSFDRDLAVTIDEGKYHLKQGDPEKAISCWQKVLQADPDSFEPYPLIAEAQLKLGRLSEAVKTAQTGLSKKKNRQIYSVMARIYTAMGQYQLAKVFTGEAEKFSEK